MENLNKKESKKNKIEEDLGMYDMENIEESMENDEMSDEEAAFMDGYLREEDEELEE